PRKKRAAMKKFFWKFTLISACGAILPVFHCWMVHAQNLGSTVRVLTDPPGASFLVDGQGYRAAMSAIWPAGSKHTLEVPVLDQEINKARFSFNSWSTDAGTAFNESTIPITADPAVTEYRAKFTQSYALTLRFFSCPDVSHCNSPGSVLVNNIAYS